MPWKCLWAACLLWLWLDASRERLPGTAVHPKPNNLLESSRVSTKNILSQTLCSQPPFPPPHALKRCKSGAEATCAQALAREHHARPSFLLLQLTTDAQPACGPTRLDDRLDAPQPGEEEDRCAHEYVEDGE